MEANVNVAIACCRRTDEADAGDLYPDPDSELLAGLLVAQGIDATLVSWDDPDYDWALAAAVVVRSTWDSVDRPEEYVAWARRVDSHSALLNPASVVEWNIDKSYLEDLAGAGVGVVPTHWVRPGQRWTPPEGRFVVKPSVSAGGRDTALYGAGHHASARAHVARLLTARQTVMIQPFQASVDEPGEISLVFVQGRFSHAVRKGPVLELGSPIDERPWERMTFLGLTPPSPPQLAAAQAAVSAVQSRFGQVLLYARVDLLDGAGGEPLVLEVELIDPNLSLLLHPPAASALALAISARVV